MTHSLARLSMAFCLVLGAIVFSSTALTSPANAAEEWPKWLQKEMKKEKRVKRGKKFATKDGFISGRMPGKLEGELMKEDDFWAWSTNIGSAWPASCWAFTDPMNMAFVTNLMSDSIFETVSEEVGKIKTKTLLATDASHVQGHPTFNLEWLYTVGEAPEAQAGLLKVRSAEVNSTAVVCVHNELGYRKTFAKSFEQLIESLNTPSAGTPYYQALYIFSVGDRRVGYSRASFELDGDGDTKYSVADSMLLPSSATSVSTTDSSSVGYSTPTGSLINEWSMSAENGETVTELNLDRVEDEWVVSGTFQGKPLETKLATTGSLVSELGSVLAVRQLQDQVRTDKQKQKVSLATWLPEADPTQAMPAVITVQDDAKTGVMTFGPLTMNVVFDQTGNMDTASYDIGGAMLTVERVWEQGEIPPSPTTSE